MYIFGERFARRIGLPERRGETVVTDDPAIKGRGALARFPTRLPASSKCTSHLGSGLMFGAGC